MQDHRHLQLQFDYVGLHTREREDTTRRALAPGTRFPTLDVGFKLLCLGGQKSAYFHIERLKSEPFTAQYAQRRLRERSQAFLAKMAFMPSLCGLDPCRELRQSFKERAFKQFTFSIDMQSVHHYALNWEQTDAKFVQTLTLKEAEILGLTKFGNDWEILNEIAGFWERSSRDQTVFKFDMAGVAKRMQYYATH